MNQCNLQNVFSERQGLKKCEEESVGLCESRASFGAQVECYRRVRVRPSQSSPTDLIEGSSHLLHKQSERLGQLSNPETDRLTALSQTSSPTLNMGAEKSRAIPDTLTQFAPAPLHLSFTALKTFSTKF